MPISSPSEPDIDGAIALLASEDEQVRQFTAYLLGEARAARAVDALIGCLSDPHVGVRGAAANALGKIGDVRALPHLEPLLLDDNRQLVVWVAFALTRLGKDFFHVLVNALRSDDVAVRRSGVLALHQLGDARAIPHLLTLRDDLARRFDGDTTVAQAVVKALAALGHTDAPG